MTVTSVVKDVDRLELRLVCDFEAAPDRVWQVWADPRRLERWWGPPEWPATFLDHDLRTGGRARYVMTGPDGTKAGGWWRFTAVDAPRTIELEDGFADDSGEPDDSLPVAHVRVTLEDAGAGTRMTVVTRYPTLDELEKVVAMGMVEGMTLAAGQIDAVLADL
ncbi:SRPBCC family protein [Cellulomonas massiliensis]|uniref:SRPBCC family protein n=1 Tax=Cellulomonas massiliensis TaxID=1465811 RepID=UPI0002DE64AA|nr:SRPBCC domain-containing protein [Cellulomonas massiliensis]